MPRRTAPRCRRSRSRISIHPEDGIEAATWHGGDFRSVDLHPEYGPRHFRLPMHRRQFATTLRLFPHTLCIEHAIKCRPPDRPTISNVNHECQSTKPLCKILKTRRTPLRSARRSSSRPPLASHPSSSPLSKPHHPRASPRAIPMPAGPMTTSGRCRRIWIDWADRQGGRDRSDPASGAPPIA